MTWYRCFTCNEQGTEIANVDEITPNNLSVEYHLRAGHDIKFYSSKEDNQ